MFRCRPNRQLLSHPAAVLSLDADFAYFRGMKPAIRARFALFLFLFLAVQLFGQEYRCGTVAPEQGSPWLASLRGDTDTPLTMLVKLHLIRTDDGDIPFSDGWVYNAIDAMNEELQQIGVELKPCGPPTITDDSWLSWSSIGDFNAFAREQDVPGYLNIYLKQYTGMSAIGAYSQFPGGFDHMVFGTGGTTMAIAIHEIGHFLSLRHTHEFYTVPGLAEHVDGSNCATAGDYICDTPASPDLSLSGLLDLDCNYTGDLTDPLGVPYEPSTDNHMSYAFNQCRDNFTSGQFDRMAGSRDALRFYMVQGEGSPGIYGLDPLYCVTDTSTVLPELRPAGGTLLIDGEPANTFVPAQLGAGSHTLTYTVPAGTLSDDSGPQYTALQPMWTDNLERTGFWQGIKTHADGHPDEIALRLDAEPGATIDLALYSGIGTSGDLLWQTPLNTEEGAGLRWHRFALDAAQTPMLYADSTYTLAADFNGDTLTVNASSPFYGYAAQPSDNDFARYTHAIRMPQGTCDCSTDSVTVTINVGNPLVIDTPDLFPEYCLEDSAEVILETTNPWTVGTFLLNGDSATSFVPVNLGAGSHDVVFLPNPGYNHGCSLPGEASFAVVEPPVLDLPDTLCFSDSPFALEPLGISGTFSLNGDPVTTIVPGTLNPGDVLLNHTYFNPLDTSSWQDTQHLGSGMLTNTLLGPGDIAWQSFVPDSTGQLDRLELYISNYVDTAIAEITVYSGAGIGGEILVSVIDTLYTDDPFMDAYFTDTAPVLFKDSVYTVQVAHIWGNTPSWLRKVPGGYPEGNSSLHDQDGSDFIFRLSLMDIYTCGSSTSHIFTVVNCTVGVEEGLEQVFKVYPNPSQGQVFVETQGLGDGAQLSLCDATGRVLRTWPLNATRSTLAIFDLSPGWYMFRVEGSFGHLARPLVIQRF